MFPLLKNKSWETRVAASQAIENISKNVPLWSPPPPTDSMENKQVQEAHLQEDTWMLDYKTFDIENVVKNGVPLLSSPGKEFEEEILDASLDPKERLDLQRKQLKQKLGLGTEFMDGTFTPIYFSGFL